MKTLNFKPSGICARGISVSLDDDDIVRQISFDGGCDGNHKGLVSLCIGMKASDVIEKLQGIKCGFKQTSCPDQLAKALIQAGKEN